MHRPTKTVRRRLFIDHCLMAI